MIDPRTMALAQFIAPYDTPVERAEMRRVWRRARPQGMKLNAPTHMSKRIRSAHPERLPFTSNRGFLAIMAGALGAAMFKRRRHQGR